MWRVNDPDWIIILFFIFVDSFIVEKIGGIILQDHSSGKSHFGKLGSKKLYSHFEELIGVFWIYEIQNLSALP
jgi:hypothetical protein